MKNMTKNQEIGLLGAGVMALPIGLNLVKAGYNITVWNRTLSKCDPLVEAGAKLAQTPTEAVKNADVVLSIMKDDKASQQIWQGGHRAVDAIKHGSTVVELSTITPEWSRSLAAAVAGRSADYLEAPMAGGPQAAQDASLILLIGGGADALDRMSEVFGSISRECLLAGEVGAATTLKIIRNSFLADQVVGLAETISLAEKAGLNMQVVTNSILKGPTASPLVAAIIEDMVAQRQGNDFTIELMRKDVSYALAEARRSGISLRLAQAVDSRLAEAEECGLGQSSVTMLAKAFSSRD